MIEVYRITPVVGKYYYHAEYDRQEGRYPNTRYFVSPNNLRFVGQFIKQVRQGWGDGSSATDYFILNNEEEVSVNYSYEGRTCFLEYVSDDFDNKLNSLINDPSLFDFIKDDNAKIMLRNAYEAITKADCWSYMKKDRETYMFANDTEIWKITDEMSRLGFCDHSGSSFGFVMREMQYIAQNGFINWKNKYLLNQN